MNSSPHKINAELICIPSEKFQKASPTNMGKTQCFVECLLGM